MEGMFKKKADPARSTLADTGDFAKDRQGTQL